MTTETLTPPQIDAVLDKVTKNQLKWKSEICRRVAIKIVESFLPDRIQWLDDIDMGPVPEDGRNIIGCTFRMLAKYGIIKRMEGAEDHRRSKMKSRRGGIVFKYRLTDPDAAVAFLKLNGWVKKGQPELPL
jgi:hypothetical protein